MAADRSIEVRVTGLASARRAVRKARDTDIDHAMQAAYKEVSSVVAEAAKQRTPERSGSLRRDTYPAPTKNAAQVRVGRRGQATGKYAGPNVYGWPGRFRGSESVQRAIKDRWRKVRNTMENRVDRVLRRI